MSLTFTAHIAAGDPLLDGDLRSLALVETGAGARLYAATGSGGGITAWHLQAEAAARLDHSLYYGPTAFGLTGLAVVQLGGQPQLVLETAGAGGAGARLRHPLDAAGRIGRAETVELPGGGAPAALAARALADGAALYAVEAASGRLGGWRLDAEGQITGALALRGGAAADRLQDPAGLALAQVGPARFLLAADAGGVTSYHSRGGGGLRPAGHLGPEDGLGLARPTALETVQAFGETWVVLAAAGSSSLSVMRLGADGGLGPADHLVDTRATRFAGVTALEVVKAGSRVFVLAGGADDGLSLFTLLPGGRLLHLETLAQAPGLGLENVTAIAAAPVGAALQIFVASGRQGGLSQFALPLDGLTQLQRPGGSGAETGGITEGGTGADDPRAGRGAGPALSGGGGDDILVAGAQGGRLTGGAGADIFVLSPTAQGLTITDFEPGRDRLDLGLFPLLRSPDQIALRETGRGAVLSIGDTVIRLHAAAAEPLAAADIWPGGFAAPDRVPLPEAPRLRWTEGGARGERLLGHAGADLIEGGGGADSLRGRAGADQLHGERGADRVYGGPGDDLLTGGAGGDRLAGRGGSDRVFGQAGPDQLAGGRGADLLAGGRGDDHLTGGAGADSFRFGADHGRDTIADFTPGRDQLHLALPGIGFADLTLRAAGTDTVIRTGAGRIRLEDVAPAALDPGDMLFG